MNRPKLLVLDGQGVVFDAPIKRFLGAFAHDNRLDYGAVMRRWEDGLRHLAWTGAIDDDDLWHELAGKPIDVRQTMLALSTSYQPGPVASYLATWSQQVPIWLLSNHRSSWLVPQLVSMNLVGAFQRLLISDATGLVKPDPNAFGPLLDGTLDPGDILFVDDQLPNVHAAEQLGLKTLHASPHHGWVADLNRYLHA